MGVCMRIARNIFNRAVKADQTTGLRLKRSWNLKRNVVAIVAIFSMIAQPMYGVVASQVANAVPLGKTINAASYYVDDSDCDRNEVTPKCTTISGAIAAANDGDTILLRGNFNIHSEIVVDKEVTIQGQGYQSGPVISAKFNTNGNNNSLFELQAPATITNVRLNGVGNNIHGINAWHTNGDASVWKVELTNFGKSGLNVGEQAHVVAGDLKTSGNGWHAIDVDKDGSWLELAGVNSFNEAGAVPVVYIDDVNVGTVEIDNPNLYSHIDDTHHLLDATNNRTGDRAYFVKSPSVTNLTAKFKYDTKNLSDGQWLNRTSKPGGSDLVLNWDAPTSYSASRYVTAVTRPDGSTDKQSNKYHNTWLTKNGFEFGNHGDGAYTYSVVAYNKDNGTVTDPVTFVLNYDHTAPTATITSPTNYVNTTKPFTVTGTYNDATSGVGRLHLYVSAGSTQATGSDSILLLVAPSQLNNTNGNFTYTLTQTQVDEISSKLGVNDGDTFNIRANVFDNANNWNNSSVVLTADNTAPNVTLMTDLTNPVRGLVSLKFNVDDGAGSGVPSPRVGNKGVYYKLINVDGDVVSVRDTTSLTTLWMLNHNSVWASQYGDINTNNLDDGVYTIEGRAIDNAGNESVYKGNHGTQLGTLVVDNTAPTLNYINRFGSPELTNHNNVKFLVKFSEDIPGLSKDSFELSGGAFGTITKVTKDSSYPDSSRYYVEVEHVGGNGDLRLEVNPNTTKDAAGNSLVGRTHYQSYTIDNDSPVVSVTPGAKLLAGQTTFNIQVTDTHLDANALKNIWVYLYNVNDGSQQLGKKVNLASGSGTFSVDTTKLDDGSYTLDVGNFKDLAGNNSDGTKTDSYFRGYTIDNTAPTIDSLKIMQNGSDISGGITNDRFITVQWAGSDSNIDHYVYTNRNGDHDKGLSTHFSGNIGGSDGVYTYTVYAVDKAGNVGQPMSVSVTFDSTAPVVDITAPSDSSLVHGTVTISGTVSDNNPDHYYLVVKDASNHVVAGPHTVNAATVADYSWDTTGFADGVYTIELAARDAADNRDSNSMKTVTVTVDNNGPTVDVSSYTTLANVITPTVDASDSNGPLTFAWTTTVPDTDVSISDPSVQTPSFTVHKDGTYEFTLTTTDALGNETVKTFSFTYKTPATPVNNTVTTAVAQTPTTGTGFTNVATTDGDDSGVLGASTKKSDDSNKDSDTLGASTQKSDDKGWNIFNLAWYWWLLILAVIAALIALIASAIRRRQANA